MNSENGWGSDQETSSSLPSITGGSAMRSAGAVAGAGAVELAELFDSWASSSDGRAGRRTRGRERLIARRRLNMESGWSQPRIKNNVRIYHLWKGGRYVRTRLKGHMDERVS